MKMFKDGTECNVQKEQVEAMKNAGWSRKEPEAETPEAEVAETPEEETPKEEKEEAKETPAKPAKKRKPIARKTK